MNNLRDDNIIKIFKKTGKKRRPCFFRTLKRFWMNMINYLSTEHAYTMSKFLEDWGKTLQRKIIQQTYAEFIKRHEQKIFAAGMFPDLVSSEKKMIRILQKILNKIGQKRRPRIYIFSDLERVDQKNLKRLGSIWMGLQHLPRPVLLLNNPLKVLKRLPLLNKLYVEGINDFNAYPVTLEHIPEPSHFPVFIRQANEHDGSLTGLIHSQSELENHIYRLTGKEDRVKNPIVTEFISLADKKGHYRKFGAFRIGASIIPVHIHIAQNWMVKATSSVLDERQIAEEWGYIQDNPHEKELMTIFKMANVEYGRIDYGLYQGKIQVFEINTNPIILKPGASKDVRRQERKQYVAKQLIGAFEKLGVEI